MTEEVVAGAAVSPHMLYLHPLVCRRQAYMEDSRHLFPISIIRSPNNRESSLRITTLETGFLFRS